MQLNFKEDLHRATQILEGLKKLNHWKIIPNQIMEDWQIILPFLI